MIDLKHVYSVLVIMDFMHIFLFLFNGSMITAVPFWGAYGPFNSEITAELIIDRVMWIHSLIWSSRSTRIYGKNLDFTGKKSMMGPSSLIGQKLRYEHNYFFPHPLGVNPMISQGGMNHSKQTLLPNTSKWRWTGCSIEEANPKRTYRFLQRTYKSRCTSEEDIECTSLWGPTYFRVCRGAKGSKSTHPS